MPDAERTLLLIDANSLIHRSYHALPPLTTQEGKPVGAIYGLASILLKIFREERPEYAVAAFDRPEPTFRKKEYEAYKAQRPKAPEDLIAQIIEAHELFEKFGIQTVEEPGFEADDCIATLAQRFSSKPGLRVVILTGDLDTLQLVEDENVVVRSLRRGVSDTFLYDVEAVKARYGLAPDQLVDYKIMVGDASDNIKGIPGVGPKTASELLQQFGTIEAIYENLARIRQSERFLASRDEVGRLRTLLTLRRDVTLPIRTLDALGAKMNKEALRAYFIHLGFTTLANRLEENFLVQGKISTLPSKKTRPQGKMF